MLVIYEHIIYYYIFLSREYKKLLDEGIITKKEFEKKICLSTVNLNVDKSEEDIL